MEVGTRPFSAGSRQAPDPYDQFLEQEGFYRKHTARDSTCLFRVVSEQMFDIQLYHEKVRSDCINFMRKNRQLFEQKINGNFEEYLEGMSKHRSFGSFLELNALAHAYQRNVLLFEPYNCGTWFVKCESYETKDSLKVFFSPDKHFDSIFSTNFIEQAAYCQAVVYGILYINVFKLPDVMYSVERMLHDSDGRTLKVAEREEKNCDNESIVVLDGRQFLLSTAAETECVLDNYRLCHFHNKENFAAIVDIYRNKKICNESKDIRSIKIHRGKGSLIKEFTLVNPMLCDRNMSCVRQLLQEGITPFPYKVAKALDPSIYRNIEFDSWSDTRRELKYQNWYCGGNNLQVGVKCMVRLNESDDHLLNCYIQDMKPNKGPCMVYVEEIAEIRTVPHERLQPLSPDQCRRWDLPHQQPKSSNFQHANIYSKLHKKRNHSKISDVQKMSDGNRYSSEQLFCYTFNNVATIDGSHSTPVELVVMPCIADANKNRKVEMESAQVNKNDLHLNNIDTETTDYSSVFYDVSCTSSIPCNSQSMCYSYSESFPCDPAISPTFYAEQLSMRPCTFTGPGLFPYPIHVQNSSLRPTGPTQFNAMPVSKTFVTLPMFQATRSVVHDGSDLPFYDLVTLRYFYNMGVDHFRHNQFYMNSCAVRDTDTKNINTSIEEPYHSRQTRSDFENTNSFRSTDDSNECNYQQKKITTLSSKMDNTQAGRKFSSLTKNTKSKFDLKIDKCKENHFGKDLLSNTPTNIDPQMEHANYYMQLTYMPITSSKHTILYHRCDRLWIVCSLIKYVLLTCTNNSTTIRDTNGSILSCTVFGYLGYSRQSAIGQYSWILEFIHRKQLPNNFVSCTLCCIGNLHGLYTTSIKQYGSLKC
ncbi:protein ovarian tumor locus-like isoform X2 [Malaya genurostris]|uniref:protein ovarian tumor locus-like isoform X2 n=1 Tax=Malaya genurostris TaxID=325434 RepID=UPI0026F3DE34|nr:protein ovarian tumor locus-like isoform X2 [Malaya genurostris]